MSSVAKAVVSTPAAPPAPPAAVPLIDEEAFRLALEATTAVAAAATEEGVVEKEKLTAIVRAAKIEMLRRAELNLSAPAADSHYKNERCAQDLAHATDILIMSLFVYLREQVFLATSKNRPRRDRGRRAQKPDKLALLAIGGYGAAKLAPFSDIDLLFLLPRADSGKERPLTAWIELMLQILWDSGFKLGYSVRDVKDTIKNAKADMVFCTALLSARLLSGEPALFENFQKRFTAAKKAIRPRKFVQAKLNERNYRHEKEGSSRFLVEPNVKNSKGGLRDLQTLWWLAKFCYDREEEIFNPEDYQTLHQCEGFLWEVRCRLHFLCQGAQEKLNFQHQPAMAEKMGFFGKDRESVEEFMKHYFLNAKQAGNLTRILCAQLENEQAKPLPKINALIKRLTKNKSEKYIKLARRFIIEGGRLNIEQEDAFVVKPINMLRYFEMAAEHNLNFHPFALAQMKKALPLAPESLRNSTIANKMFLHILTARKEPARILRTMNETGLLGWFVPEFGKIVAQMQFNRYHHYTVDEHLIHAIEQASHLEQTGRPEIKRARKVANQIQRQQHLREVLYLALFTHDIAKGQGGDHSILGAEVCLHLAQRFGLAAPDAALAVWLVDNHLLMSDVAQKRDLSDDKTIRNFVRDVQTTDRLKLLFLLTIADICAVGPGTWSGWKAQLLDRLYELALAELTAPAHRKRTQLARQRRRILAAALNWSDRAKRDYLKKLSDAYWCNTEPELQLAHATLWHAWQEKTPFSFSARDQAESDVSEIVVMTQDHPGLFSRIVGAIALSELRITDTRIFTSHNGLAFDSFWVQTHLHTPIGAEHSERLKQNIHKVLAGELLPHEEIAKKQILTGEKTGIFNFAPQIEFDNEASDIYSVIEIECLDQPYLLHSLSQKLFREGMILSSAHVATYGERVVGAFYIQDAFAQKITSSEKQQHLMAQLLQASTPPPKQGVAKN